MQDLINFITGGYSQFTMNNIIAFFVFLIVLEFICALVSMFTRGVK